MENLIDSVSAVEDMRTCSDCGETKELSKFPYNRGRGKDKETIYYRKYCYTCKNNKYKESDTYKNKPQKKTTREKSQRDNETKRENIQKVIWGNAKDRVDKAVKDGKKPPPFTIVPSDIVVNNYCPQLGIRLVMNRGVCKDNSYSLDKIVPSKGYIPGNIQVVSNLFNRLKSDAENEQQLMDLHKFYKNNGFLKD